MLNYLVVASFSPFLQSQTTIQWLSSRPTEANFLPSPSKVTFTLTLHTPEKSVSHFVTHLRNLYHILLPHLTKLHYIPEKSTSHIATTHEKVTLHTWEIYIICRYHTWESYIAYLRNQQRTPLSGAVLSIWRPSSWFLHPRHVQLDRDQPTVVHVS
jgi:hypothetical protein